ncbi:unknown [Prevotella sp. CAG:617]|nr:unknown [Prevotella sp. CAG:617]
MGIRFRGASLRVWNFRNFMNCSSNSGTRLHGNVISVTRMTIWSPACTDMPRSGLLLKPMNSGLRSRTPGALITNDATLRSEVSSTIRAWSSMRSFWRIPWSVSKIVADFLERSRNNMAGVDTLLTLTSRRDGAPNSGESWGMGFDVSARSFRPWSVLSRPVA